MPAASGSQSGSPPFNETEKAKGKKRIRNFTADERATHRVIEKQRREALNESFLNLARLVPNLAQCRRLSKSLIVHESEQCLKTQRELCIAAANEVQALLAENMEMITELNTWREQFGIEFKQPRPVGEALQRLMLVDQEVLGSFPGGFGDNKAGEDIDHTEEGAHDPQAQIQANLVQNGVAPIRGDLDMTAPTLPEEVRSKPPLSHLLSNQGSLHTQGSDTPNAVPEACQTLDHQMFPPDADLLNSFNNSFGIDSIDGNLLPMSPYTEMNLQQSMYHDFNLPLLDIGFSDHLPHTQHTQRS